jgi:hypothetical protein
MRRRDTLFCCQCGTEIPNEASFCWKCGKPQKHEVQQSTNTVRQDTVPGHWEYKEFIASLANSPKYKTDGVTIPPSIPDPRYEPIISSAVRQLLEQATTASWEPIEPIDAGRLWQSGRVDRRVREVGVLFPKYEWTLLSVKINFRRWKKD